MPLTRPILKDLGLEPGLASPTHQEGLIFYDDANKTAALYNDEAEVTLQVGQEMWARVYNNSGGTITNGQVVYMTGINAGFPTVALARADAVATANSVMGLATHDIENSTFGYVTFSGLVRDLNTGSYATGDRLFLSTTTAGAFTTTQPTAQDEFIVEIGLVSEVNASTGSIFVNLDFNTQLNAESVNLLSLGNASYDSVQQMQDIYHSAGWADGGAMTDGGSGTLNVATGSGYLRAVDSLQATLYAVDWPTTNGIALADNDENYIYVEYNGGTPQVVATATERTEFNTNIYLGNVYREGTELHINETVRYVVADHTGKMIQRMQELTPYARASGALASEVGTRNLVVTSGVFWEGLSRFTTTALDTSTADDFTTIYRDGVGGFTTTAAQSVVDNTNWDDGTGTLNALTNNYYTNRWIYVSVDSHYYVVYGQGEFQTLAEAEAEGAPASSETAPILLSHGRILAKVIVQQGTANFIDVLSTFTNGGFASSGSQNLWAQIDGDSGTTTANSTVDTLTIAGGTNTSTSVSGDTLTINQDELLISTVSTANATPTLLTPTLGLSSDSTIAFTILVTARRTDVDNESAGYKFEGVIDNNAGTTALVGTVTKTVLAEDTAAWDANVTANDGTDTLDITVTGEAAKTISWRAKVDYNVVTG